MAYELTFTRQFKDGLERTPQQVYPILDRCLDSIEADPYAKIPNAKPMRNGRNMFRMRIGIHVRLLYRVQQSCRRVMLLHLGPREGFYPRTAGGAPLPLIESRELRSIIKNPTKKRLTVQFNRPSNKPADQPVKPTEDPTIAVPVMVEHLPWISEDELFLLQVPQTYWESILNAGEIGELKSTGLSEGIRLQIEDYWTNPASAQIDKLYALGAERDIGSVARKPLSQFILALDPEQREALKKLRTNGPYLIKGAAGTGKTLVGLYHIRDLIQSRASETLFEQERIRYGVITYTNTLVDSNHALLRAITPKEVHSDIHCSTLDKISYDLASKSIGGRLNLLSIEGISNWIKDRIRAEAETSATSLIDRLGPTYIAEEIEQVIIGNGLTSETEYVESGRRGRKRGLRESERRDVWRIYRDFRELSVRMEAQTFEEHRSIALEYLRRHPDYPRFSVLFVDEAQDFSKVAKQLCLELVRDPSFLLMAADTAQSIYSVPISWSQVDPRLNFQRRRPIALTRGYRTTHQISKAIGPLRVDPGDEEDRSEGATPVFTGPKPRWISAAVSDHAEVVRSEIQKLVGDVSPPIHAGRIAVITRSAAHADQYKKALDQVGIDSRIVKKGSRLEIDGEHVHIITAHSSKGLGFPVVFVPDVSDYNYPGRIALEKALDDQQREQVEDMERRLLYVALSRASHKLFMLVDIDQPSRFLHKLNRTEDWE